MFLSIVTAILGGMFKLGFGVLGLAAAALGIAGGWRAFRKAGRPGLLFVVPILNLINLIDLAGKPLWWCFLLLIPGVNLIVLLLALIAFARRFGHGTLFGVGLLVLPPLFWFLLGFDDSRFGSAAA
jgi:hypothetical protein